ncbi:MAG: DUF5723 family protein [Marinifilaceae bacterium]
MRKILYTVFLLLLSYVSFSQEMNNTLYFMRFSPQANSLNPAINPEAKVWVGFPGFTSLALQYNNNSFNLEDVLIKKGEGPKPVKIDIGNLYNAMSKNTTINLNSELALFSLGIKVKEQYFTLDIKHKNSFGMGFDKSFFGFFKNGPTKYMGKTVQFGDTQMNVLAYNEIALGYSRVLNKESNFVVGGKIKLIMGVASLDMSDSNISMDIAPDGMSSRVRANMDVRIAGPLKFNSLKGAEFKIDDMAFDDTDIVGTLLGTNNLGLGIDIGAKYDINNDFSLYASILDLGFINWADGMHIKMKADYDWKGANFTETAKNTSTKALKELTDTLEKKFKLKKEDNSYMQMLPTKIYIGGQYKVKEWLKAGLLNRTQFYNDRLYTSLTASANFKAWRRLSASVSYTMANNSYNNIGFGFTAQAGPLQLYLVTDNVLAANFTSTQLANVRLGLNIRVGVKNKMETPKELYVE